MSAVTTTPAATSHHGGRPVPGAGRSAATGRRPLVAGPLVTAATVPAGPVGTQATGTANRSSAAARAPSTRAVSRVPSAACSSDSTSPSRCTRATRSPRS